MPATSNEAYKDILNVNVGVLGHVDSGKTSLVKALSTLLSTAALDKSKASRERGMTLDLGFSCFFIDKLPAQLQQQQDSQKKKLQITLVDCPGHATLIRTIMGGAQIIDMVLLVVDAYKGWQAQTTECLVLAELTSPGLVIALNKADQFDPETRQADLQRIESTIRKRLQNTRFCNAPCIGVAAFVGGEKVAAVQEEKHSQQQQQQQQNSGGTYTSSNETWNVNVLVDTLVNSIPPPRRRSDGPFYFAIDHCFVIRGRGTVLTGTVLSGSVSINDVIEFPTLSLERKIKSIQMFKRPVPTIVQGDRAGICVANLDATLLERGIAAKPGAVPLLHNVIALVKRIPYYNGSLNSRSKFHISVGHTTVMATVTFWGAHELLESQKENKNSSSGASDADTKAVTSTALTDKKRNQSKQKQQQQQQSITGSTALGGDADLAGLPKLQFDFAQDFLQQEELLDTLDGHNQCLNWALLEFPVPVHCPMDALIIGSRLDVVGQNDSNNGSASSCRLAFTGRLLQNLSSPEDVSRIRWYTPKEKRGTIVKLGEAHERSDDKLTVRYEVFGSDLFKKETNMKTFIGMKAETESGEVGEIKSSYGTEGRFRVSFPAGTTAKEGDALIFRFKRYANDANKLMHQDIVLPAARSGKLIETKTVKKTKEGKPKLPHGIKRFGEVTALKGDVLDNGKHSMAIIGGIFDPALNIKEYVGTKIRIQSTNEEGSIVGPFGKAGKCKVEFSEGISATVGQKAEIVL